MKVIKATTMIESLYTTLSQCEKRIAKYILNNGEKTYNLSIQQLAIECSASEASIIRFCKKIGFSGFKDLKLSLASEKAINDENKDETDVYSEIITEDSPETIMRKLNAITIKNLTDNMDIIDYVELEKAINLIQDTKDRKGNTYIVATGGSGVVARDFQLKLMRLGINSIMYENSHLMLESLVSSCKDDVAVIFSTLGKSKEILDFVEVLNKNNTKVISITQYNKSKLTQMSDITILTANVENNLRLGSMVSRIIQLSIVDTIFTTLSMRCYEKQSVRLDNVKNIFKEKGFYK